MVTEGIEAELTTIIFHSHFLTGCLQAKRVESPEFEHFGGRGGNKANLLVFLPICAEKNPIETPIFVLINILNFYQLY